MPGGTIVSGFLWALGALIAIILVAVVLKVLGASVPW